MAEAKNVLIIGAGAIGAGLAQHLLHVEEPWRCLLTWHSVPPALEHPNLTCIQADPRREADMRAVAQTARDAWGRLHWVINCTGALTTSQPPEKHTGALNRDYFLDLMDINVWPTLLAARTLEALLDHGESAVFAAVSAKVGSIGDNRLGGWYSYRASKAALNMALKTLSIEWRRRLPRCCVAALHPGTTRSKLSEPFSARVPQGKYFPPQETALYLYQQMQRLKPEDTGAFIGWDGRTIVW